MRNIGAVATLPVGTRTHLRTKVLQLIDLHSNDGFLHSNDGFSHSNDGFLHSNDGCCTRGSCCDESVRVHAVCCLYTRRRLIDLPLIAGTRNRGTLWGWCSTLKDTGSWMGGLTFGTFIYAKFGREILGQPGELFWSINRAACISMCDHLMAALATIQGVWRISCTYSGE